MSCNAGLVVTNSFSFCFFVGSLVHRSSPPCGCLLLQTQCCVLVPTEAAHWVWQGRSQFRGVLAWVGPQENARMGWTVLARSMERVRNGTCHCQTSWVKERGKVAPASTYDSRESSIPPCSSSTHPKISQCI